MNSIKSQLKESITILVLNMTYLGSKYIDVYSWPTLDARFAENRGQKVGHLAKMHDFRLQFEQHDIALYITFTIQVLDMTYLVANNLIFVLGQL